MTELFREGQMKKERELLELKTRQVKKGREVEAEKIKQREPSKKVKHNKLIAVAVDNRISSRDSNRLSAQVKVP